MHRTAVSIFRRDSQLLPPTPIPLLTYSICSVGFHSAEKEDLHNYYTPKLLLPLPLLFSLVFFPR